MAGFDDRARQALEQPAFAKLALRMPDDTLQNTVMWYRLEQDTLRMIAPAASAKARALQRSPSVAIVVDDPENPYAYVEVRGRAEVVSDDRAARAELRRIAGRYIGADADAYVAALSDAPRVLIVIHPERVRQHQAERPRLVSSGG